jgi:hypothetical protein
MDERIFQILQSVAQGIFDSDYPMVCRFCFSTAKSIKNAEHDDDCETMLARQVLTELGKTW